LNKYAASEFFLRVKRNARTLVQPCLVAIYEEITEPKINLRQIGTGFRIQHRGRPVLVTAKHTLYGHSGDENPGEKAIYVSGKLELIGNLGANELVFTKHHDLAAIYVDQFSLADCLPPDCLCRVDAKPRIVTIQGFLARDFKRDAKTGTLRPAPRAYTNSRREAGDGYIGIRYPKSRNRDTESGMKVMVPIPSGLSGGPMLDSARLADGNISIIGVFTDHLKERGIAFGESSAKLVALLRGMESHPR
jgi:hypothetical protein